MADAVLTQTLTVRSRRHDELIDVTEAILERVRASGIQDGVCVVFTPHTTAGVLINENADPGVLADVMSTLDRLVPWRAPYQHNEDNAAAHIKTILVGVSQSIPVQRGRLQLGRWQGIFLAEFDGPRERELRIQVQPVTLPD